MAFAFADVVRFTATSGGTGSFTVAAVVTGFKTPAQANTVDGFVYRYRAENASQSEWEVGYGTMSATGTVLSRTPIFSSNSNALTNFSAAPQVAIVILAEDAAYWQNATSSFNHANFGGI